MQTILSHLQKAVNHLILAQKQLSALDDLYGELNYLQTEIEYIIEKIKEE